MDASEAQRTGPSHRGLTAFLTMLVLLALPIVAFAIAVNAAPTVHADGSCTGIGFGCTPSPHDGLLLFGFLFGLPALLVTVAIGALLNGLFLKRSRWHGIVIGLLSTVIAIALVIAALVAFLTPSGALRWP
ncbi:MULTISPECIES: hypothetical protein [unclassified Microbacterium]|uniref:hypothetical protein n=1 Tax=unclassified Microbacterium TaxID=2609290 RepID=UPI0012FB2BD7|nr:hypothetical protein [Microbacterium sp. MAH-37]MVQ43662.1 hypothetical protein [Microbacterium sp. MAH-37]